MPLLDVGEVVLDPEFVQTFVVYRSTGSFVKGKWTEDAPTLIEMKGVVSVAASKDLRQVPEGDRITGAMVFHSTEEIFSTRTGTSGGTSDKVLWRGEFYKVWQLSPYVDYGYYRAIGERIKGA